VRKDGGGVSTSAQLMMMEWREGHAVGPAYLSRNCFSRSVYVQAEEMIHLSSDFNLEGISSMKVSGEKNVHYNKGCRCLGEFTEKFLGVNPLDDAWSDVFYRKG